ncbi:hypothetical protein QI30_10965 [Kurthia sp. 3B1D]|uniref:Uncharacterized protein n=1 Tax=Candidatus Kurthia intestinigallinarum TaxID=1562256 RepID=A0A433RTG3_9BACL|nr:MULTISPECIES: YlaF family protein [unclassified Kurthia]RUS55450.1 hypothetical protein QI30_10965 [Kurthia sp. 3B1D]
MNKAKLVMMVLALAGVLSMCSIGVAVAEKSVFGTILGIVLVVAVFGYAFSLKRKFRERGLL